MKTVIAVGLLYILSINMLVAHDIHVSVAELEVNDNGQIEVSLRIFFDDLLLACGLESGEELPKKYTSSDDLISQYVSKHFKIFAADHQLSLTYIESFSDNMAVWIELKSDDLDQVDSIDFEIENTILLKEFDDQLNLLNYSREQKKESYTFNHKKQRIPIKI